MTERAPKKTCSKCGHSMELHDTRAEINEARRHRSCRIGCVATVYDRGASWAVERGPCGCEEINKGKRA